MIKILTKEIPGDGPLYYVRKNFLILANFFKTGPFGQDWKVVEASFTQATTDKIAHGLGAVPTDVLLSSKTGAGSVTLNYDQFDAQFLSVTTTGPCKIRLLVSSMVFGG